MKENGMQPSVQVRYSIAFKRQVVEELESGRFRSIGQASEHYGVTGATTIRSWLKKFGKVHLMPKVVRVEKLEEADQIAQLKKENRQLREALSQTQLENILNQSFLRIACRKMGEDVDEFKKKAGTTRSTTPESKPQKP